MNGHLKVRKVPQSVQYQRCYMTLVTESVVKSNTQKRTLIIYRNTILLTLKWRKEILPKRRSKPINLLGLTIYQPVIGKTSFITPQSKRNETFILSFTWEYIWIPCTSVDFPVSL